MLILCLLLAFSHWQLAIGFFVLYKFTPKPHLVSKGSSCNARHKNFVVRVGYVQRSGYKTAKGCTFRTALC